MSEFYTFYSHVEEAHREKQQLLSIIENVYIDNTNSKLNQDLVNNSASLATADIETCKYYAILALYVFNNVTFGGQRRSE